MSGFQSNQAKQDQEQKKKQQEKARLSAGIVTNAGRMQTGYQPRIPKMGSGQNTPTESPTAAKPLNVKEKSPVAPQKAEVSISTNPLSARYDAEADSTAPNDLKRAASDVSLDDLLRNPDEPQQDNTQTTLDDGTAETTFFAKVIGKRISISSDSEKSAEDETQGQLQDGESEAFTIGGKGEKEVSVFDSEQSSLKSASASSSKSGSGSGSGTASGSASSSRSGSASGSTSVSGSGSESRSGTTSGSASSSRSGSASGSASQSASGSKSSSSASRSPHDPEADDAGEGDDVQPFGTSVVRDDIVADTSLPADNLSSSVESLKEELADKGLIYWNFIYGKILRADETSKISASTILEQSALSPKDKARMIDELPNASWASKTKDSELDITDVAFLTLVADVDAVYKARLVDKIKESFDNAVNKEITPQNILAWSVLSDNEKNEIVADNPDIFAPETAQKKRINFNDEASRNNFFAKPVAEQKDVVQQAIEALVDEENIEKSVAAANNPVSPYNYQRANDIKNAADAAIQVNFASQHTDEQLSEDLDRNEYKDTKVVIGLAAAVRKNEQKIVDTLRSKIKAGEAVSNKLFLVGDLTVDDALRPDTSSVKEAITESRNSLRIEESKQNNKRNNNMASIVSTDATSSEKSESVIALSRQLEQKQARIDDLEKQFKAIQDDKGEGSLFALKKKVEDTEKELANLGEKSKNDSATIADLKSKLEAKNRENNALKMQAQNLAALQAVLASSGLPVDLNALTDELQALKTAANEKARLEQANRDLQQKLDAEKARANGLQNKLNDANNAKGELEKRNTALQRENDGLKDAARNAGGDEDLRNELNAKTAEAARLADELAQANSDKQAKGDKIAELERAKAEEERKFNELDAKYKEAVNRLQGEAKTAFENRVSLADIVNQLNNRVAQFDQNMAEQRGQYEQRIRELGEALQAQITKKEAAEGKVNTLQTRVTELESEVRGLKNQAVAKDDQLRIKDSEINSLKATNAELNTANGALTTKLTDKDREHQAALLRASEASQAEINAANRNHANQINSLRAQHAAEINGYVRKLNTQEEFTRELTSKLAEKDAEYNALVQESTQKDVRIRELEAQLAAKDTTIITINGEKNTLTTRVSDLTRELTAANQNFTQEKLKTDDLQNKLNNAQEDVRKANVSADNQVAARRRAENEAEAARNAEAAARKELNDAKTLQQEADRIRLDAERVRAEQEAVLKQEQQKLLDAEKLAKQKAEADRIQAEKERQKAEKEAADLKAALAKATDATRDAAKVLQAHGIKFTAADLNDIPSLFVRAIRDNKDPKVQGALEVACKKWQKESNLVCLPTGVYALQDSYKPLYVNDKNLKDNVCVLRYTDPKYIKKAADGVTPVTTKVNGYTVYELDKARLQADKVDEWNVSYNEHVKKDTFDKDRSQTTPIANDKGQTKYDIGAKLNIMETGRETAPNGGYWAQVVGQKGAIETFAGKASDTQKSSFFKL